MRIFGTVRNSKSGAPIEGAKIKLYIENSEIALLSSEDNGQFEYKVEAEHIGQTLNLVIKKDGYSDKKISYDIDKPEIQLEVLLEEYEIEIKGKIFAKEANNPLKNASITFKIDTYIKKVISNEDGSFSFTIPQQYLNKDIEYEATKEEYQTESGKIQLKDNISIGLSKKSSPTLKPPLKNRKWLMIGIGILTILIILFIVVSMPPPPVTPTVDIMDAPATVEQGSTFKITWRVNSNVKYEINHTAVHYGPESKSEPLALTSYPEISNVHSGLIPATFSSNLTINTPGVIYFRAHAIINNVNYWSKEKSIVVSMPPPPSTPTVDIMDAPATVEPGSTFKITWSVNSNVEYQINHTAVHYGPESKSEPLAITSYPNISNVHSGLIPATFSSNITLNTPGVIYFRAHAIIDNVNYWSEEKSVTVSEPAILLTPTIHVTSYPISVKGDTNFTIRWKVSGGTPGRIHFTLVHWGWKSGGPNIEDYSRVSMIQNGYTPAEFSAELKAPSGGSLYFRSHAMVDDTDLYSPEYKITIITSGGGGY